MDGEDELMDAMRERAEARKRQPGPPLIYRDVGAQFELAPDIWVTVKYDEAKGTWTLESGTHRLYTVAAYVAADLELYAGSALGAVRRTNRCPAPVEK